MSNYVRNQVNSGNPEWVRRKIEQRRKELNEQANLLLQQYDSPWAATLVTKELKAVDDLQLNFLEAEMRSVHDAQVRLNALSNLLDVQRREMDKLVSAGAHGGH
jgi:hypothetical protein